MKFLHMIQVFGKFLLVLAFLCYHRGVRGLQVLVFPIVGALMAHAQFRQIIDRREVVSNQEHEMSNLIHKTATGYELVVDYRMRPTMNAACERSVAAVSKARVASNFA